MSIAQLTSALIDWLLSRREECCVSRQRYGDGRKTTEYIVTMMLLHYGHKNQSNNVQVNLHNSDS